MRILSIETSCDETAISILDCTGDTSGATFKVLGNALYSQAHLHAEYGGVHPTLAKREHIKNLPILLEQALGEAGGAALSPTPSAGGNVSENAAPPANVIGVELIAVTQGPGLEPALWTGIEFAKELGQRWSVPVVGTDHMEGHIMTGLVEQITKTEYHFKEPELPILALLISGGHTELVLMKEWLVYELIGRTKDDAIGEAFDKVARLLDMPYPGGPEIDKAATRARARGASVETHGITFPRPLIHENSCDFSFSGLKTAVLYKLRSMPELSEHDREHIAQAFEEAARDSIIIKTRKALEETGAKTLSAGGGVTANAEIRTAVEKMVEEEFLDVTLAYPHPSLTGDNAIMIGMAAYLRHSAGLPGRTLAANGGQSLAPYVAPQVSL
ncbi:MAG: tRNA (adenosine(37)-N6)-threonylcarbamoyltransferase complex transferase subunit TsaD [Patescibacteria group bacterium]